MTLARGLNVIVGENNSGKTAFLDAIRVALGPAAATGDFFRLVPEDRHRATDGTYCEAPIAVTLIFANLSREEQGQFIDLLNYSPEDPANSTAQLNFQWSWNSKTGRYTIARWGGAAPHSESGIPDDVLQTMPVTLLGALRDAASALLPGRNSRLAHLLSAHATEVDKTELVAFALKANEELEKNRLVANTQGLIGKTLKQASGPIMAQQAAIKTAEPEFDRIVQSLRLVISRIGTDNKPVLDELRSNGLGFNNLLFIATVVLELNAAKTALWPLLLVEEPEAHLRPQLQTLLADFLSDPRDIHPAKVQTLVTSHSPTIAAHVSPACLRVLHRGATGAWRCGSLGECGLDDSRLRQLRRMFDVTKATLLFAKGVILVEGITEALLLPVLARRAGFNLEHAGVSVVPVCGVDFGSICQLYGGNGLHTRMAVVTDGDAGMERCASTDDSGWESRFPRRDATGKLAICDRIEKLLKDYATNEFVQVFHSDVTLEYSLAAAGQENPWTMCRVWEAQFDRTPRTLNTTRLKACGGDRGQEVLAVWRGICLSDATCSKAEFAQALAEALDRKADGKYVIPGTDFTIPDYLLQAFNHVVPPSAKATN